MKKVLLSSLALIAVSSLAFGIYSFNKEKIYKDNEVNCDFDAGMCYDLKNKPITGRLQSYDKDKLVEVVKTYGAKGLAYTRLTADAETSSFEKFLTAEQIAAVRTKAEAEKHIK